MSSSSSDPSRRDDEWGDQGSPGSSGDSGGSSSHPTGWERPSFDSSSGQPTPPEQPGSTASSSSSASDWPTYPPGRPPGSQPSGPEPTRSFSADQPPPNQAGYQPYDPQAMPGYGNTGAPGGDQFGSNPYGSNPYEANPYAHQPMPYGGYQAYAAPAQHPQATTAFVLGLLGLVVCPPVGVGGLVMGGRVRREIDASGGQLGGKGLATAGWVLGIISVVYFVAAAIFLIFAVVVGAGQN